MPFYHLTLSLLQTMFPFIAFCVIVAIILALGRPTKSINPCRTCKWLVPGTEPKCGFYKTSYDILGGKINIHEYAEHVRNNEHMCGEEGYMYETLLENTTTISFTPFTFALFWPLNAPFAVLTGLIQFLHDDEAVILRCF
jgi:hypothetical protein